MVKFGNFKNFALQVFLLSLRILQETTSAWVCYCCMLSAALFRLWSNDWTDSIKNF